MIALDDKLASADCHLHPDFSVDARGDVEEFVAEAKRRGLRRICFTTHVDLDPRREACDMFVRVGGFWRRLRREHIELYLQAVEAARRKHADEIEIVAGFEFSYEPHYEDRIRDFIEAFRPDFTIGSVHSIDSLEITSRKFVASVARVFAPHEFVKRYYDVVVSAARSGLFSVIGHIDGYKKYLARIWGLWLCEELEREHLPRVASALADAGAAFEVNTSGWRKGLAAPYPAAHIIRALVRAGTTIGAIGSDAHKPDLVGDGIERAMSYIEGALLG